MSDRNLKRSGRLLWVQIADRLRGDIEAGSFPPGTKLPTEAELSARFRVNRHTVRQALASLEQDGLVQVTQGKGRFVSPSLVDYKLGARTRFSQNLAALARTPGRTVIDVVRVPADKSIAEALGLSAGAFVWRAETTAAADGVPLTHSFHYFDAERFPDLDREIRDAGSITRALAEAGVKDYTRQTTRLSAQLSDEDDARWLDMPTRGPILQSESINVDPDGQPLEYGISRFAGDRLQVVVETRDLA